MSEEAEKILSKHCPDHYPYKDIIAAMEEYAKAKCEPLLKNQENLLRKTGGLLDKASEEAWNAALDNENKDGWKEWYSKRNRLNVNSKP